MTDGVRRSVGSVIGHSLRWRWVAQTMVALSAVAMSGACAWAATPGLDAHSQYASARAALFKVEVRRQGSDAPVSSGTAFATGSPGLLVTNLHVVSQALLDRQKVTLAVLSHARGESRVPKVLAVDAVNDLALLRVDGAAPSVRLLRLAASDVALGHGQTLHALGYPLGLEAAVVTGAYNGRRQGSTNSLLHVSASFNPGMSGGPVLSTQGSVVGVVVGRNFRGEQVGYAVPVATVHRLVSRAATAPASGMDEQQFWAEVREQLVALQADWTGRVLASPWPTRSLGGAVVAQWPLDDDRCIEQTDDDPLRPPASITYARQCGPTDEVSLGDASIRHYRFTQQVERNVRRSAWQMNDLVNDVARGDVIGWSDRMLGRAHCQDLEVQANSETSPGVSRWRVVWCGQAYRQMPELYRVRLTLTSRDDMRVARVARLDMGAVTWSSAQRLTQRFVNEVTQRSGGLPSGLPTAEAP